ncbi:MAG: UDP-N-acetylmuramate--L-alanine ligase [Owenweeksia sp.]
MLDKDNIYLIGIGGIGMSALARYFRNRGKQVAGYDRVRTPLCKQLEEEGMAIHYEDDTDQIPQIFRKKAKTTVIYTPAVPEEHTELQFFRKKNFDLIKRAQILGMIAQTHTCLAVAGTHGKTTTSTLLAHLFRQAGRDITAFLGGISVNYQTNFWGGNDETSLLIAEADEFDRSFLQLKPEGALVTSMDADHLDIYGDGAELERTFRDFAASIQNTPLIEERLDLPGKKYGFSESADFRATNIRIEEHTYRFDLKTPGGTIENIKSGLPGRHNVENAAGAAALALEYGLSPEEVKEGIETFKGVKRRFEYHIKTQNLVYIDDYAHHPTEINALINSVRELYPQHNISGIFQPHLYSRTRDFADGFAESLNKLDELILMDIYPAREKPIPGINSTMLLERISDIEKLHLSTADILTHFRQKKLSKNVILTIGAGDIDQLVNPLKMVLLNG